MVIALAGRRIDELHTDIPRFPLQNVGLVEKRLTDFLLEIKATALVCSGACGADLIALKAAQVLDVPCRLVLPFKPSIFIPQSVSDRPGDWKAQFEAIYHALQQKGHVHMLEYAEEDVNAFKKTNIEILKQAEVIRQERKVNGEWSGSASNDIGIVLVWEGAPKGSEDMTWDFKLEGERRGYGIFEIRTLE